MAVQLITEEVYALYTMIRTEQGAQALDQTAFQQALDFWYTQFQSGECSLGYAASQLEIGQIDFITLLDRLGWKVTNI